MKEIEIIYYLNVLVWLFPPVRNYKTKYFLFFIIIAAADPFGYIMYQVFGLNPGRWHLLFLSLLVIVLTVKNPFRNIYVYGIIIIITAGLLLISFDILFAISIIPILLILLLLLKEMFLYMRENYINIFYVMIILYIISILFKFIFYLIHVEYGYMYYYATTAFEILIGLYFCFFNLDNSKKIYLPVN